MAYRNL